MPKYNGQANISMKQPSTVSFVRAVIGTATWHCHDPKRFKPISVLTGRAEIELGLKWRNPKLVTPFRDGRGLRV